MITIEAPTAEQALEEVSTLLGADAQIVEARKVHRGGVAGFFAREMVQLTARRTGAQTAAPGSEDGAATARAGDAPRTSRASHSFRDALERLVTVADTASQLAAARQAAPSAGAGPSPGAGSDGPPVSGMGEVAWSPDELIRVGLSFALTESVVRLSPRDDLDWVWAIARIVSGLCRPFPQGPALLVGPRADALAAMLGAPAVSEPHLAQDVGTVYLPGDVRAVDPSWLTRIQGDRWLHLVAGGEGWEGVLALGPRVISWVGHGSLVPALRACAEGDLILGYGTFGDRVLRAQPVDIALAIRDMVVRR
ncbi:MAG TPA: hypothetical protein VNO79_11685 [Actinomycetota bacterium]|nr:hypothetical protein [Actinomycetota bacterium]